MKIKNGLILCKVGETYVVVASGNVDTQLKGMTSVNETGAFIWEFLLQPHTVEETVEAMTREFDVDAVTARRDVEAFVQTLQTNDFLEQ